MERQFVSFEISGMKYCIDIMDVQEVVRENKITRMPDVPVFVEGIINLRGIVVPVISLSKKMGIQHLAEQTPGESKKTDHMKLIIVRIGGVLVGFHVNTLDRVFSIEDSLIQSADGVASAVDRSLIEGVAKVGDVVYIILNGKKLLDFEEKQFIKEEILD